MTGLTTDAQGDGAERPSSGSAVRLRFQILGPLRVWRDGLELDLGPSQQAYLLALLLAREGEPISTTELLNLIWDYEVPPSALNVIHKYVGALRRLLEPELPVRRVGSHLMRRGDAYVFVAGPGALDLVTFREHVIAARALRAQQRDHEALDWYVEAVGLWHGSAGGGRAHGAAAMPTFAAIDDEFFNACMTAAALAVTLGRAERVLPSLLLAAGMAPLHEGVQANLITTLAAAGRQAEALANFRTVRMRLAEDLGVEPGPDLRAAHERVLRQTLGPAAKPVGPRPPAGPLQPVPADGGLIGRSEEMEVLRRTVQTALTGGTGLAVVSGEPGVGKTRLLQVAAAEAGAHGALVVWGHCLDDDGTPAMWPWVQAVGAVVDSLPSAAREKSLAGELGRLLKPGSTDIIASSLPDGGGQFRMFEQVVAVTGEAAERWPVVFVIDDLQWADDAALRLFRHLTARLPRRTAIIGALRDRVPVPVTELSHTLAAVSRVPGHHRIHLGPFNAAEVTELIQHETGNRPDPGIARTIHVRTAGNPFFVRELSRTVAAGGTLGDAYVAVPPTVHDIVRDRMADLDDRSRDLLQVAALIGRDVDLNLLARATGLDIPACLESLEPLDALALLEPDPLNPYARRFPHDLVREAIVGSTPPLRAPRLHLRIADAMENTGRHGVPAPERLAHQLWAAGHLADPARTAEALIHAGGRAAAKSALASAERHLRSAAAVARKAGLTELELSALSLLTAVVGMKSGYLPTVLDLLERAEQVARGLGRELEATEYLYSRRAGHSQAVELDRSGPLSRQLLEQGEASTDPIMRAYGLHSWGIHQWDVGNIGEAYRYLSQQRQTMLTDLARRDENRLRHDLQLLSPVMLAMMSALFGDVDAARELLDTVEIAASDDPFAITVWAAFASTTAALVGDAAWAMRTAQRGIAQDPDFVFVYLGTYQRIARCWAQAMSGDDPAGSAAEADRIITRYLTDPPLSGASNWSGLLGEMWLAAGRPDRAAVALDQAEHFLNVTGQRFAEGRYLLLRARLLQAQGEPATAVRAAAERARALSVEREAHLFVRHADEFLAALASPPPSR